MISTVLCSSAALQALAPALTLAPRVPPAFSEHIDDVDLSRLAGEGYVAWSDALPEAICARLRDAIASLVGAGLPAVTVYAFEEPWQLGERVRTRVSALLGCSYALVDDAWAWQIAPGRHGWPAHRGTTAALDRAAPELINVWVALSDACTTRSCMHVVPLDADPHYPDALQRSDVALGTALPVAAGSILAWNANVLHWGGRCAPDVVGPRVSCSFSLARGHLADELPLVTGPATFAGRLDSLARQIMTYGEGQPDISDGVREWAQATTALRRRIERLRDRPA